MTGLLGFALVTLWVVPASLAGEGQAPEAADTAGAQQQQVLTWTADDRLDAYASAPETAVAGPATIVFENSVETGNTSGVSHTLTFDTSTEGYNHDVDVDIVASPFDSNQGRHEVEATLTAGQYRYFCAIPGHGEMQGVLTVTDGGGGEDTTAPSVQAAVTGEQDADGNYVGSATVTVSAEDAGSGVDSVEYSLDGGAWTAYAQPLVVDAVGEHSVRYRATDVAGNVSTVDTLTFEVVEVPAEDTTAPAVSAVVDGAQDADGNYVGSATVTVSAEDAGSGVDSVEYSLDGGAWTAYAQPLVVDAVGEHSVRYRATDVAGNVSDVGTVTFTVAEAPAEDTTPPTVSSVVDGDQDADGNYVGSATVTLSAEDAGSGVAGIEFSMHGGDWTPYVEPLVIAAAGTHSLEYRASDNAGNVSETGMLTLTIVEPQPGDTTPPEVSAEVTGETDADGGYVGSATVTLSASDSESGVATIEYSVDGREFQPYSVPVTVADVGEHTLAFRATDNSGNVSAEDTVAFTVVESGEPDACPDSDTRATVIIGAQDSGVANVDTGDGCTINDRILEEAGYANHGAFVDHVKEVADGLAADGVISKRERASIVSAAARSDIGK